MTSEHISETVFCELFNCSHCDKKFADKPNARISLAQKLDIIEASKKSGFSIEDVMKKYGLKKSTVYRSLAEKEKYTQQEVNTM